MQFKYLYQCIDIKAYNRVKQLAQIRDIGIITSRKHMLVLSENLIPLRKTEDVELDVFAKLDSETIEALKKCY